MDGRAGTSQNLLIRATEGYSANRVNLRTNGSPWMARQATAPGKVKPDICRSARLNLSVERPAMDGRAGASHNLLIRATEGYSANRVNPRTNGSPRMARQAAAPRNTDFPPAGAIERNRISTHAKTWPCGNVPDGPVAFA